MYRPTGIRGGVKLRHEPTLRAELFRTGETPTPPPSGDVTGGLHDWGMLGNDRYGCCGVAAFEHIRMAKALCSVADGTPTFESDFAVPTTESTEALYFAYGKAQGEPGEHPDEGVANADFLKWLFEQGEIEWFAELDVQNVDEVHQAMLDCYGVLVAVALTDDAEQLFSAHEPWTVANGETPDQQEGHDIALLAYAPDNDAFVTWGAVEPATPEWVKECASEAWVFGSREDGERAGFDVDACVAAIRALGGNVTTK